ncbi:MAG: hypothetical protein Q8O94_04030, partial [bacterium]|nr:hypothetical protein [bacterium]
MKVRNLGTIRWKEYPYGFCLTEYQRSLEEIANTSEQGRPTKHPSLPGAWVSDNLDLQAMVKQELEKGRMPLEVSLVMEQGYQPRNLPVECVLEANGKFSWVIEPGERFGSVWATEIPLFQIVQGLASRTGHRIVVSGYRNPENSWEESSADNHRFIFISFFVTEDIRNNKAYLKALAHKMSKWANAVP